ncbi:MAG TPA: dCMP deaminase family protein [Nitrospirota bacterium]|nr:dCMP deaminase family protein [Nitrospirota bacterium]
MIARVEKLPDTDTYYMGIAIAVREKANCRGNRVGAVLVLENRVIATGYNGVPEGMKNCLEGGCLRCRNPKGRFPSGTGYDLCICVHAEQNALLSAARFGISVQGATLYTTMQPCFGCAKELLQAHVKQIVYLHEWTPSDVDPEMDSQKKAEYQNITARLDPRQICIADPRAEWAVSALRKKSELRRTHRTR